MVLHPCGAVPVPSRSSILSALAKRRHRRPQEHRKTRAIPRDTHSFARPRRWGQLRRPTEPVKMMESHFISIGFSCEGGSGAGSARSGDEEIGAPCLGQVGVVPGESHPDQLSGKVPGTIPGKSPTTYTPALGDSGLP